MKAASESLPAALDRALKEKLSPTHVMEELLEIEVTETKALSTLRFVEEHLNVLLLGPPGVGKTHLAVALGGIWPIIIY